jgi:hypothetical protein
MADWYDYITVPSGVGALERATLEAVRKFGLDIQLDQVGWTEETVTFLIETADYGREP